jgi:hypothetical protein
MRIKLLLSILLLTSFKLVKAQWTNEVPANAWVYNFSLGTAGSLTATTTTISNLSSQATGAFLPAPPSGTSRVLLPSNTNCIFELIPTTNKLVMTSSVNTTASKFSVFNVSNASAVVTASLTLEFTGKVGADAPINNTGCQIGIGTKIAGSTSNPFENTSSVFTPANNNKCLFNAIRFQYNATSDSYTPAFRASGTTTTSTTTVYTNLSGGALSPSVPYKIDIYCNNASISQSYTFNGSSYTVAAGTYHLWITNTVTSTSVRYFFGTNTFDIPKTVETANSVDQTMPAGSILNSFLVHSDGSNTNGLSKITINGGMRLSYDLSTLPVSLTSFNGSLRNNEVALAWQTASELNNDYFMILRAGDDKNFQEIAKVYGRGNTNQVSNYNFLDQNPLLGNNYYKLKQVDKDGTVTLHEEVVAVKTSLDDTALSILTDGNNSLKVQVIANQTSNGTLLFYNINGQKILETKVVLNKGLNQFSYDASLFKNGIFIARVAADGLQLSKKFVKN